MQRIKIKQAKWMRLFLMLCLSLWLSACGKFTDDGMLLTGDYFNVSGSIGELLSYAIDTNRMLYSYIILESDYGLKGILGRGTLTQDPDDRTYIPSNDPNASLILIPDTFLVGGVEISHDTLMFFAGVPAISQPYNPNEIAGTYNYITFACDAHLDAGVCTSGYKSYYGTFIVDPNGTWQACDRGDIDDPNHYPCQGPIDSGEWTDPGNGRIQITSSGIEVGTAMFLPSQINRQILIMDLKDRPALSAGPGMLIGIRKQNISSASLIGTYRFNGSDASYGSMTVTVIDPNIYVEICYDPNMTVRSGALSRNNPWEGWLTSNNDTPTDPNDDNMILMLPGLDVFLQTSPTQNDWFHMGGKIPMP